jgi:uncharacterized protein YjbI with pentapeptide repeats
MAVQQHLDILKRGVSAWNQWRIDNPGISPDLSKVSLQGIQLEGVHLEGAHLTEARLEKADLRGAYLQRANLYGAHLERADLYEAHLEEATLYLAHLERAVLKGAFLTEADLNGANMEEADLNGAHLEKAKLKWAHLKGVNLYEAHIEEADLHEARLERADLRKACLKKAILNRAHLEKARLSEVHLEAADLGAAHLEGADLGAAHLEGANLVETHLEGASLKGAYLEGKCLREGDEQDAIVLHPADLRGAYFDSASNLDSARLGNKELGFVSLADVRWENVNLAVVDWKQENMLGDEYMARQMSKRNDVATNKDEEFNMYRSAVRANRQLAVELRNQGLNEEASKFAYRAQKLQRIVLFRQKSYVSYLFSVFLDLLAGYGFRPKRSLIWYLVVIFGFAITYHVFGHLQFFPDTLVLSLTSFHGRGFFPGLDNGTPLHLYDPLVVLATVEAVIGLFIEISFIATFTKRFFGN